MMYGRRMTNVRPGCKLCQAGVGYLPELSEKAVATKYGVHSRSVGRHRKHLRESGDAPETAHEKFLTMHGIPTAAIKTAQLSGKDADGQWHKVSWNPSAAGVDDGLSDRILDEIRDSLQRPRCQEPVVSAGDSNLQRTFVINLADVQLGKTGSRGNSVDTINRLSDIFDQILTHLWAQDPYGEIVLVDNGDVCENFTSTSQQAQTNDLPLTHQILGATDIIMEAIKLFSPLAKKFCYVAVSSNHCQVRSGMGSKNQASFPGDDFGLMISKNIEKVLEDRPEFENVKFVRTSDWEESVTYETSGTVIGFTHGHLAGSQSKLGEWFKGQSHGRRSGLHLADLLIAGHFHNFSVESTGSGQPVIVCPSVDNGSDWFANASGKSYPPSMLTLAVNDGSTEEMRIWK